MDTNCVPLVVDFFLFCYKRGNQIPHMTQDTNGKVTTSQLDIPNESHEVKPNRCVQFKKIIKRRKIVNYNMHSMRQSACLVVNPIRVYGYGSGFNCTTVGHDGPDVNLLSVG